LKQSWAVGSAAVQLLLQAVPAQRNIYIIPCWAAVPDKEHRDKLHRRPNIVAGLLTQFPLRIKNNKIMKEDIIFKTKHSIGTIILPYVIIFIVIQFESIKTFDFRTHFSWLLFVLHTLISVSILLLYVKSISVSKESITIKYFISFINRTKVYPISCIEEIIMHNYGSKVSVPQIKVRNKGDRKFIIHSYFTISRKSIRSLANVLDELGVDVALLNSPTD
jgi:hypothetical protein